MAPPPGPLTSAGSSPPTRGTRAAEPITGAGTRLIPAHAGNTGPGPRSAGRAPAHPRPRGEHKHLAYSVMDHGGSSPPTRGTRGRRTRARGDRRLIPAHAGNTSRRPETRPSRPAHPRPRGEHGTATSFPSTRIGSSPPTRGTRRRPGRRQVQRRLIPAHAGNTVELPGGAGGLPAHPRPRGEHAVMSVDGGQDDGSSPPTRGTRLVGLARPRLARLIPAHAGNTT